MYYYIVNPSAGGEVFNHLQDKLKITLKSYKISGYFAKTLGPGDASRIASSAIEDKNRTLVIIGGNDTVQEVLDAVYTHPEAKTAIGIIPTGKTNKLASRLGITDWKQACKLLAARRITEIRPIVINGSALSLYDTRMLPFHSSEEEEAASDSEHKPANHRKNIDFKFELKVPHQYSLNGRASMIEFTNLRLVSAELSDKLAIHINRAPPRGWKVPLLARKHASLSSSQVFSESVSIKTLGTVQIIADAKTTTGTRFRLALGGRPLRLIA